MTILESLQSLNAFPVVDAAIEKICVERGLIMTDEFTLAVSVSKSYRLATADVYVWIAGSPNLSEQSVGVSQTESMKDVLLSLANNIYYEYDDPKYDGTIVGFVGENYNA